MDVFKRPLALALSKSEQVNGRVLEDNNFHVGVCVTGDGPGRTPG